MSRKTEWRALGGEQYAGLGQRVLTSDAEELGMLEVRGVVLGACGGDGGRLTPMELSLRERLQPALFDRLIDDERLLTLYEVSVAPAELQRLGLTERDSDRHPGRAGLQSCGCSEAAGEASATICSAIHIERRTHGTFAIEGPDAQTSGRAARHRATSLLRIRDEQCGEQRAGIGGATFDCCAQVARLCVPRPGRPAQLRQSRRLDRSRGLSHVQRSVLNYGMPSLAGRMARSVEAQRIGSTIEAAIANFEPRLSRVRVTPELGDDGSETHVLALSHRGAVVGSTGTPAPGVAHSIDVDSGDVSIADSGMR